MTEFRICEFCGKTSDEYKIVKTSRFGKKQYFCNTHYYQMVRNGEIKRTHKWKNEIIEHNDYLEIMLYDKSNNVNGVTKVSKEHRELIGEYKWYRKVYPNRYTDYVVSNTKGTPIRLHSLICEQLYGEKPDGMTVDHINRDGLDNRNENLRYLDQTYQNYNQRVKKNNKLGIAGVCQDKRGYWHSQIIYKGFKLHRCFKNKDDAIKKRKHWELLISQNRIEELYRENVSKKVIGVNKVKENVYKAQITYKGFNIQRRFHNLQDAIDKRKYWEELISNNEINKLYEEKNN